MGSLNTDVHYSGVSITDVLLYIAKSALFGFHSSIFYKKFYLLKELCDSTVLQDGGGDGVGGGGVI